MDKYEPQLPIPHSSINELCGVYAQAEGDIRAGLAMITAAQASLAHFFDGRGYGFSITRNSDRLPEPDAAIKLIHKAVWRALAERLGIRRLLSLKRVEELDKQLESGEGLPPITFANVVAMLDTNLSNVGQYLEEKIRETYEWLRPRGYSLREYKTNQASAAAGVGRKVILSYGMVRGNYSGRGFQVNYGRTDNLRALDQVFHLLDGKPALEGSWQGELCDAIEKQTKETGDTFKTDYFAGRCFGNGNLHLVILRADLLQRFNLVAGGARLQDTNPTPKPEPAPPAPKPAAPKPETTATAEEQIKAVQESWAASNA